MTCRTCDDGRCPWDTAPSYALPRSVAAEMARAGLHDLNPWWSPDHGDVDPLDDPETRQAVRTFMAKVWRASSGPGLRHFHPQRQDQ